MTDSPLYLPASLIPDFVTGRVSLLIEPLKVQPRKMIAGAVDVYGVLAWQRGDDGSLDGRVLTPHFPGDRLITDDAWAEVTGVEVKLAHDVTEAEAMLTGVIPDFWVYDDGSEYPSYISALCSIFNATHGPDAWANNPWCAFTKIKVHQGRLEESK